MAPCRNGRSAAPDRPDAGDNAPAPARRYQQDDPEPYTTIGLDGARLDLYAITRGVGRITYQMMEEAWRLPESGVWPEWMPEWMTPFAETIDQAKKYVVSTTLDNVDWNSELVRGHLASFVRALKEEPGDIVQVGGVTLPITLANLGLIDEYEFVVQPIVAGHGPRLLEGLRQPLDLQLVDRSELDAGTTVLRYRPGGSAG